MDPNHDSLYKVFKKVKQRPVKKFNNLQRSPRHRNTLVPEYISKKWVINLMDKELTLREFKFPKGPKFAVASPKVPATSTLQLPNKSVKGLARTMRVQIVMNTTKTLRTSSKNTRKRRNTPTTSPKKKERQSNTQRG